MRTLPPTPISAAALLAALVLSGCTAESDDDAGGAPSSPTSAATSTTSPSPSPSATADPYADYDDRWSLPALFDDPLEGSGLRTVRQIGETDAYTRYEARYRSGDLTISGQLDVPQGGGTYPAVVLNHGYIDPDAYVLGQGMPREQDALARAGFVVLHTDYRGHAASDDTTQTDLELRLGYTRDTIAAVKALEQHPRVDAEKVGMVGRSMGGGVTLNALVADPDIVKAAVVYASVSSRFVDNHRRWTAPERPDAARALTRLGGSEPSADGAFWRGVSSRTFFDRVEAPILMHHGVNDGSCDISWAYATRAALEQEGKDVRLHTYEGEGHTFEGQWQRSMDRTIDFLREKLDA